MSGTTVVGTISHGLLLGNGTYGVTLSIGAPGLIVSSNYGVYASFDDGRVLVSNAGSIVGYSVGISLATPGTIENAGSVDGGIAGVFNSRGGAVYNTGQITGGTFGAVVKYGVLSNAGSIGAEDVGVDMHGGVFNNSGQVSGYIGLFDEGFVSVIGTEPSTVYNAGTITGLGTFFYGAAVYIEGEGSFTNAGLVTSPRYALFGFDATVTNTGTLAGLANMFEGTLLNEGLILNPNGFAAFISNDHFYNNGTVIGGTVGVQLELLTTMQNQGTITAVGTAILTDGGTIFDSGLIDGGHLAIYNQRSYGGSAYELTLDLILEPGASIVGAVVDQSGLGQIALAGSTAGFFDMGDSFSGINQIRFDSSAAWTLEGSTADLAAGQTLSGMIVGDSLILDGFAATSDAFIVGTGLVLSNAYDSATIQIAGSFQNSDFIVGTSGNDTMIEVAAIPRGQAGVVSTTLRTPIILGSSAYATILTVTNTGAVLVSAGQIAIYEPYLVVGQCVVTNAGIVDGINLQSEPSKIVNSGTILVRADDPDGTIFNSGLIVESGLILSAATGANVTNSGTILGTQVGVTAGTLLNYDTITSSTGNGIGADVYNIVTNYGLIGGAAYAIYLRGYMLTNAGTIEGTIKIDGNSLVIVKPGAVFDGAVEGDTAIFNIPSTLVLGGAGAGTLDIGTSFTGFDAISFANTAGWVLEGALNDLATGQAITGFVATDTIKLDGYDATGESYVSGLGLVLSGNNPDVTLEIEGSLTSADFTLGQIGDVTEITTDVLCFCLGTRIATSNGMVAVEMLRPGDIIHTAEGFRPIRWIGTRAYESRFIARNHLALPVCIQKSAIAPGVPSRDLYVSPGHGIFMDGVLVAAWRLVNGKTITQAEKLDTEIHYYHIELASHAVILAENCPVESYLDTGTRSQFQNAARYVEREPAAPTPLPRVESGPALEAIKAKLNARAGLQTSVQNPANSVTGYVDHVGLDTVSGWALCPNDPETPVSLDVYFWLAGTLNRQASLANVYRADLRNAGLGSGCHGFEVQIPTGATGVRVLRTADKTPLALTEAATNSATAA